MTEALRGIIDEIALALAPLVSAPEDPEALATLLSDLGWTPASVPKPLSDLAIGGSELLDVIGSRSDSDAVPLPKVIDAIGRLVDAINAIHDQPDSLFPGAIDVASFKATIGRDLFDYLIVNHLLQNHHRVGGLLRLAGLIRLIDTPQSGLRQRYMRRQVAWSDIGALLSDPTKGFRNAYGWDSGEPALTEVIGVLGSVLESYGLQFSYLKVEGDLAKFAAANATAPGDAAMGIDLALAADFDAKKSFAAGVRLMARPRTATRGPGLALSPYADLAGAKELAISDSMTLSIKGDVDFTKGVAVTLAPARPIELNAGFLGGAAVSPAEMQVGLKVAAAPNEAERVLIGTADGSRLAMRSAALSAGARVVSPSALDAFVQLDLEDARVVVKPAPGEGDSFLSSLLGDQGISAELSLGLRLSSLTGFHMSGSGDLRMSFPVGIHAGPVDVRSISVALKPSSDNVALEIGAAVSGSIGPVTVVLDDVGFNLTARFPDPPRGNLGPLDVDFGFKFPSGIGLSVEAGGVVSGGGFLFRDAGEGVYAGVLQLSLHEMLTLTAFGLIATRMADGGSGYSLIIFITAEDFRPLPLGLGFTLQGVGGMVAVHRTFDEEVLRSGLKNDTLGSLLFPKNVVKNAPAIIRGLSSAFPARRGSYLLGVLARIGWGTPTLVRFDLALIFEFGVRKRLLVLGRISALLPSAENDLIRLKLDAMGVIDFDQGTASIDAVLVDSKLVHKFPLTGAMALRARWRSGASFVLAVGGFNPRFAPPAGMPKLERMAIALSSGNNPRITCEAYFAITSNTVQFGARAQLHAAAYGFSVDGDIGYDVLVQLIPLHFIAEFQASVQLKRGSSNLFKVSLKGELEGPRPLRVSGKASFEILWCDFTVRFDKTLIEGEKPPLPPAVDVLAELRKALGAAESWSVVAPGRATHGVALRKLAGTGIVLDPLGRLQVKQQVVPLNTSRDIDIFGGAPVRGAKRFAVKAAIEAETEATTPLRELFAPAQYFALSDDDKLAGPSFEEMDAGLRFGSEALSFAATELIAAPMAYESIVIDSMQAPAQPAGPRYELSVAQLLRHTASGAAARAPIRRAGLARFRDATQGGAASLQKPNWRIMPLGDGAAAAVPANVETWSEYRAQLATMNRGGAAWQMVPLHELAA